LQPEAVRWRDGHTFGVVLAAPGYPEAPRTGDTISGLGDLRPGVHAFHAGTRREADRVLTSGGRVLCVVGDDRDNVYRAVDSIHFAGKQFRRDIGAVAVGASR
jgi:phosphoribosylamine--glycine ligase